MSVVTLVGDSTDVPRVATSGQRATVPPQTWQLAASPRGRKRRTISVADLLIPCGWSSSLWVIMQSPHLTSNWRRYANRGFRPTDVDQR